MAITKQSAGHVQATLDVGDIQIGAVELKNATTDERAEIGIATTIVESDIAVAMQAPVLGITTGAAVTTDAAGTIQQYLRGLVSAIAAKIGVTIADGADTAQGTMTDAAASSTVAEDTTARTGISLWKGIKNIAILIKDALTGLLYTEDTQHTSGDKGVMLLGVRKDTAPSALAGTDGDYIPAIFDENGNLWVSLGTKLDKDNDGVTIWADPYTTPTHTAVNVTTSSGQVLAANANRLYALLVNGSDAVIYIKLGAAAVLNQGIRINASGGSYEMSAMLGNLYTGAINGIHGGAGNKVLMSTEGV